MCEEWGGLAFESDSRRIEIYPIPTPPPCSHPNITMEVLCTLFYTFPIGGRDKNNSFNNQSVVG